MRNSVFSFLRIAALTTGISLSASAFAAQVTYAFTTVDGHYGSFSYEDAQVPASPGNLSAVYSLLSFTLDGVSLPHPHVEMANDNFFYLADLAYITSVDSNSFVVGLWLFSKPDSTLFTSNDLAQLDGRTLADFTNPGFNRTRLNIGSGYSELASLHQVASIPEPGTSALMALGLAALVAGARKRLRQ
jgi:hypothetical protein